MSKIDVSSCHADKTEFKDGTWCFWEAGKCENNADCYFKQMQQLKKENMEAKENCINAINEKNELKKELAIQPTYKLTIEELENQLHVEQQKLEKIKSLCDREYCYSEQGYNLGDAIMEIIESEENGK